MEKAQAKNILLESKNAQRKRYYSPKLSSFGTVAQLTRGGAPSALSDSGMNNMNPS